VELGAAVLLLVPRTAAAGAALSAAVIAVAIASHVFALGITIPAAGDQGELFALAVIVFLCSAAVLVLHRRELRVLGKG
jgi:hypothetical protein